MIDWQGAARGYEIAIVAILLELQAADAHDPPWAELTSES